MRAKLCFARSHFILYRLQYSSNHEIDYMTIIIAYTFSFFRSFW